MTEHIEASHMMEAASGRRSKCAWGHLYHRTTQLQNTQQHSTIPCACLSAAALVASTDI